jgi:hypothetical protein
MAIDMLHIQHRPISKFNENYIYDNWLNQEIVRKMGLSNNILHLTIPSSNDMLKFWPCLVRFWTKYFSGSFMLNVKCDYDQWPLRHHVIYNVQEVKNSLISPPLTIIGTHVHSRPSEFDSQCIGVLWIGLDFNYF